MSGKMDAEPGAFAIELAEFIKANPEKLDVQWIALLSQSRDPGIRLMMTAMEAALRVAANEQPLAEQFARSPILASIAGSEVGAW